MLTFNYKARDTASNKIVKSTVQAQSESEAARLLMAQHIVPLNISEAGQGGLFGSKRTHVGTKDLVIFTRQLSTMLNAGLPLSQSLATVEEQTQNKTLQRITGEIIGNINGGMAMSDCLVKYPTVFNQVYVALVRAGETSGTLDQSLERLANQQEHDADMISKIRNAMIYPAIVLATIIAVVAYMLLTLIPQVESLYKDLDKTLPGQTQLLVGISNFIISFWWLITVILVGLIFFTKWWIKTDVGRRSWDSIKLNLPLISGLMRKMYMSRFTRTSQTLLQSGVSMLETLKISADAVNNLLVRDEILQAVSKVKNGKALSDALSNQDYILPFVPQMIKIGETSGGIDAMLGKVADYYEKEVDNAIAAISTMIEPVLMILMAGMIGFVVFAVLMPIYGLSDTTSI